MVLKDPEITVLMSVYNGADYLGKAISSILSQTFKEFEFLIIDDASTDKSSDLIKMYEDHRIIFIQNNKNIGLTKSLNKGLKIAKGKYIARMDADDISLPMRFEKQIKFMEHNRNIGVCGTFARTIGSEKFKIWRVPLSDAEIRARMFFKNAFVHTSIMFRRSILIKNNLFYNESYEYAQDYDLWVRLSQHTSFANLNEILVLRRIHPNSSTSNEFVKQANTAADCRLKQLSLIGISPSQEEMEIHNRICNDNFIPQQKFIKSVHNWLLKLKTMNNEKKMFREDAFLKMMAERWYRTCRHAQKLGPWTWKFFWSSPLSSSVNLSLKNKIGFAVKCLFRIG